MEFPRTRYLQMLLQRKENGLIKVITGMRRAGKSYLMNELFYAELVHQGMTASQIIRFAFDSDEDLDLLDPYFPEEATKKEVRRDQFVVNARKFRAYLKDQAFGEGKYYILLDEVQLLEGFTGTLNGLLRHKNYDIYVTGSNSRFLSSDIAAEFKGRGTEIHVMPLTFGEYCQGLHLEPEAAWRDYLETGGIPLVALMNSREERRTYLKNLCEETYLKDIIQHHGIRKQEELGDTLDIVASAIGAPVNTSRITNTFASVVHKSISDDTIASFIDYFEDAFLISRARKYNVRGRKYIGSLFKLYFEDVGVRNARLNFRQIEESHLMENILYNELRYRGFNVDVGEVEAWEATDQKDRNGKTIYILKTLEVDFIATNGDQKLYIQSALTVNPPEKELQEKRSLYHIDDSFRKIVITKNGLHAWQDEKGVLTQDLFDFLLS